MSRSQAAPLLRNRRQAGGSRDLRRRHIRHTNAREGVRRRVSWQGSSTPTPRLCPRADPTAWASRDALPAQTCTARLSVLPGRVGWEARGGDCAALRPVSDDIGQPPRRSPSSTVHPAGFDGWRPHTILSHDSITTHRSGRTATRGACRCTWRLPEYSAACQG